MNLSGTGMIVAAACALGGGGATAALAATAPPAPGDRSVPDGGCARRGAATATERLARLHARPRQGAGQRHPLARPRPLERDQPALRPDRDGAVGPPREHSPDQRRDALSRGLGQDYV